MRDLRTTLASLLCVAAMACSSDDRDPQAATAGSAADSVADSVAGSAGDATGEGVADSTDSAGSMADSAMDSMTVEATVSLDETETVPADITTRTVPFTCADGQTIAATYLSADSGAVSMVILRWDGRAYGLARAISASGARYASLYGPTPADHGLEWWEAKGEARLSGFTGTDVADTRPLVTGCKPGA